MTFPRPGGACAAWVLERLAVKPASATMLIAAADGVWYPTGHSTLWRRVDRAIQSLRKRGLIQFNGREWSLVRRK